MTMRATVTTFTLVCSLLTAPVSAAIHDASPVDRAPAATPVQIDYSTALQQHPAQQRYRERMTQTLQTQATLHIASQTAELLNGLGGVVAAKPMPVSRTVSAPVQWSPLQVALRTSCEYPRSDVVPSIWAGLQTPRWPLDCADGECVYL